MKPTRPTASLDRPKALSLISGAALAASVLAVSAPAHAVTPPSALGTASAAAAGVGDQASGSGDLSVRISQSGLDTFGVPYMAVSSSSITMLPHPVVNVSVDGYGDSGVSSDASALSSLLYYLVVDSPDDAQPDTPVPIHIRYEILSRFRAGSDYLLEGFVQVSNPIFNVVSSICPPSLPVCNSTSIVSDDIGYLNEVNFSSDTITLVDIYASIVHLYSDGTPFSGSITVDPIFTIDPTFLQQHPGYSLELSQGVGDTASGVPEPGAWSIMLLGFGGLGLRLRTAAVSPSSRRRRSTSRIGSLDLSGVS